MIYPAKILNAIVLLSTELAHAVVQYPFHWIPLMALIVLDIFIIIVYFLSHGNKDYALYALIFFIVTIYFVVFIIVAESPPTDFVLTLGSMAKRWQKYLHRGAFA